MSRPNFLRIDREKNILKHFDDPIQKIEIRKVQLIDMIRAYNLQIDNALYTRLLNNLLDVNLIYDEFTSYYATPHGDLESILYKIYKLEFDNLSTLNFYAANCRDHMEFIRELSSLGESIDCPNVSHIVDKYDEFFNKLVTLKRLHLLYTHADYENLAYMTFVLIKMSNNKHFKHVIEKYEHSNRMNTLYVTEQLKIDQLIEMYNKPYD